jgi:carbamoyltransferase
MDDAGSRDLCLGDGVMMDCSSNGALLDSGAPVSASVFPAAGDAGLSVGAALLCAADVGELSMDRITTEYWGPDFSATECEAALSCTRTLLYRRVPRIAEEAGRRLAAGEVIGWCQGRMELGPRASGTSVF